VSANPVDPVLLLAIGVLDDACDGRGVHVDLTEGIARQPGPMVLLAPGLQAGQVSLNVTLTPRRRFGLAYADAVTLSAPYNDRTAEWVTALAFRIRGARGWDPRGWGQAAVSDVLGTVDGTAEDRDATAQIPELTTTTEDDDA
jgi:hypothetical protein